MAEQKVQIPVVGCPACGEGAMLPVGKPFKNDEGKLVEVVKCNKCDNQEEVAVKTVKQDGITVPTIKCAVCGKGTLIPKGNAEWEGKSGINMECDHCHHQYFYALNISEVKTSEDNNGNMQLQYQIPACPKCGGVMETAGKVQQTQANTAKVDVKCTKCGYEAELEINIKES